jgi:hypothetical protein
MTERSVFLAALEYDDPAERAAYLDRACAGEPALRAQVEHLLAAHERSGHFMDRPAPERLAGDLAAGPAVDDTRTAPAAADEGEGIGFLDPSERPGSIGRLGHYEVQEVVGRGGMGVVLKAFDESLHRVVAIKVMAAQLATGATARKRFAREARAAAAVTHDHVVTIHAVEDSGPLPHIVMQYVAGQSLQDRLDRNGPLQLQEILRIGMQTASGLAAAHAQGLVHRDVKPANILLENGIERVKLTDFGLARAADDASLTQSGTVAGTPAFMSPEQAEGGPVDHRSDLFSLGSVLYAMCTGRPPFRSGTSMGVLRRVCEDIPTPIRETNPEVPDWLAAVVEKLHAKDPAGRFQSAADVAELLGGQLAHLQRPSVVPLPVVAKPAGGPPVRVRPEGRTRWAVAGAVLLATFAVLGATEATGVTNVGATIVRVFTPHGTLIVETDDPHVRVAVEGDGGLAVTGTGFQELRLRPGSYRVVAERDGQRVPLERDLVTVSRGGRVVVRVTLEAPPAATAEKGAFVRQTAGAERTFDTLAEAVLKSSDGDTIEIRGNGPFVTEPLALRGQSLTIRAAGGYRPVLKLGPDGAGSLAPLLRTDSILRLEGLEFHREDTQPWQLGIPSPRLIFSRRASLHVANCRFVFKTPGVVLLEESPRCTIRNCEFLSAGTVFWMGGLIWHPRTGGRLHLENCVTGGDGAAVVFWHTQPRISDVEVRLIRNTLAGGTAISVHLDCRPDPATNDADRQPAPFRVDSSQNIFDGHDVVVRFDQTPGFLAQNRPLTPTDAARLLRHLLAWWEQGSLYSPGDAAFLTLSVFGRPDPLEHPLEDLADWQRFWGSPPNAASAGRVRYKLGGVRERAQSVPHAVRSRDFCLRPDSPGFRARPDGKDLGADVDLVGPGAAYERWKKTPDYQAWLKETGQLK